MELRFGMGFRRNEGITVLIPIFGSRVSAYVTFLWQSFSTIITTTTTITTECFDRNSLLRTRPVSMLRKKKENVMQSSCDASAIHVEDGNKNENRHQVCNRRTCLFLRFYIINLFFILKYFICCSLCHESLWPYVSNVGCWVSFLGRQKEQFCFIITAERKIIIKKKNKEKTYESLWHREKRLGKRHKRWRYSTMCADTWKINCQKFHLDGSLVGWNCKSLVGNVMKMKHFRFFPALRSTK